MLVVASRQLEVALDRAGVTNGGIRRECATEKEKKERVFTRMVRSSSTKEGAGRKEDYAWALRAGCAP
jgi:hypothetical protein